ncbi:cleavage and polyadenylation specificity factor subunit 1-like [Sesbania bispinosa]|nr:cleavage and polyadenylation specificity factor subunit 1-like [Sesbania bispinosa]
MIQSHFYFRCRPISKGRKRVPPSNVAMTIFTTMGLGRIQDELIGEKVEEIGDGRLFYVDVFL